MTLVMLCTSLAAGCSSGAGGSAGDRTSASCASIIEVDGVRYIAGRGAAPISETAAVLTGRTTPCNDGSGLETGAPTTARSIPGVKTRDALASSSQLMLSERLWNVPRAKLPPELQPYVRP